MTEFKLPNLGEGVEKGDVLTIMVKVGDRISPDQPILELETDKATIEVPSSVEGVIKELKVKPGDKVKPGQVVLIIDGNGAGAAKADAAASTDAAEKEQAAPKENAAPKETAGEGGFPPTPQWGAPGTYPPRG